MDNGSSFTDRGDFRNHDDALGVGGAIVLAGAAAGTTVFVDDDPPVHHLERATADGAMIDAHCAFFAIRAQAGLVEVVRCPHVDLGQRRPLQRPAWTGRHAGLPVAQDTRLEVGIDIWKAAAFIARVIDFDCRHRARPHAVIALGATDAKLQFRQRAGGRSHGRSSVGARRYAEGEDWIESNLPTSWAIRSSGRMAASSGLSDSASAAGKTAGGPFSCPPPTALRQRRLENVPKELG